MIGLVHRVWCGTPLVNGLIGDWRVSISSVVTGLDSSW